MIAKDTIPDGWKWTSVGQAFVFTNKPRELDVGKHPAVPFIPMDLIPIHRLHASDHVMKAPADLTSGTYFEAGDLLISKITPCFENGKQAIITDLPLPFGYATTEVIPLKAIDGVSNLRFLFFYLMEPSVRSELAARMEGATGRQRLSKSALEAWEMALPPLDEQMTISGALTKILDAIEIQDKSIATLKELKTATMAHLFSCGTNHAETKDSVIGSIPSHWEVKRIDEIADLVSGGTPSKSRPDWWRGSIPWVSPKDMKVPRLHNASDKITKEAAESGSRIVPAKTIFVVIRGMILIRDVPMAITEVPMAFNQDMKAIMAHDSVDPDFLFFAMQNRRGALFQEISTSAHGTRRMGTSVVESMQIALPTDKREQMEIRDAIRQIDDQIANKEHRRKSLQDTFASTLSALMSGSLRTTPLLAG